MPLVKLSTGIYRDRYSLRAVVNTRAGRKEKRYPLDTPIADIKRWRNERIGEFAALGRRSPTAARGTLRADVKRYLKSATIASIASRRSDLKAWVTLYGDRPRHRLTIEHVRLAVQGWQADEYQPWTIRHRLNALRTLYKALDGPRTVTPIDAFIFQKPPKGHPVFVASKTIDAVTKALTDPQTRARFLVLATSGARPVELQRAIASDVDLKVGLWAIRSAKGGVARVLRLNTPEMRQAWRLFAAAAAWGSYDTSRHAKQLRAAGWPDGVRPYALRGTWGMELSRRGVDLADIQQLMGHEDIETTRLYYVPAENSRLAAATKSTAGRLRFRTRA